jgi:hypothetical protein
MSMPRNRAMIIPIGCVVRVTQTRGIYSLETYTEAAQISHKGLKKIAPQIFDVKNQELDKEDIAEITGSPYIISSQTIGIRHFFVASKMDASSPNDPTVTGKELTQAEYWLPMAPGYFYYMIRSTSSRPRARSAAARSKKK